MDDIVRNRTVELAGEAIRILTLMRQDQLAARRAATANRSLASVLQAQAAIEALDRAIADEFANYEAGKEEAQRLARKSSSKHLTL